MEVERAPLGLLIAALGAAVLAISVFAPWYGLNITTSGATVAQQELAAVARQYGNTNFQTRANRIESQFGSLAGHRLATVSARQTMKRVSTILLALAGIALLAALLRLADMPGLLMASGSQVALIGGLGAAVVVFRIVRRPDVPLNLLSLSLSWGIWAALLGAAAVMTGGLIAGTARTDWRRRPKVGPGPPPIGRDVASPLAGFRPQR
jgi:hypothetical protein